MTLAGALAYYAGQIIESPSVAWLVGLRPLSHAVSMEFMGWTCMACAVVTAAAAVFRKRRWWVDRLGFAVATLPMAMWCLAFAWSWVDRGARGYPPGGTWLFLAVLTAIANLKLDRGALNDRAEHERVE
jgi:hypothetical protein